MLYSCNENRKNGFDLVQVATKAQLIRAGEAKGSQRNESELN